jgi:parallel beta-helix repeat protein
MVESGIAIEGDSLRDYMHEIDESNTVNGKPVYYWKDVEGGRIPDGAGQVILVKCKNVTVENQELNKASVSIKVAFSSNISIKNNNCSNNRCGIYLFSSSNNRIINNTANSNNEVGIPLVNSSGNSISNNKCSSNNEYGIYLGDSDNNIISNSNCSSNHDDGINLYKSNDNNISNNKCSSNNEYGIHSDSSSNNTIKNNNISNNGRVSSTDTSIFIRGGGIYMFNSSNNKIYLDNFINNSKNVHFSKSANIWNSSSKITYTYKGNTHTNYLGNYWNDYNGTDTDKDGIGDAPYSINEDKDTYPLVEPYENYSVSLGAIPSWFPW